MKYFSKSVALTLALAMFTLTAPVSAKSVQIKPKPVTNSVKFDIDVTWGNVLGTPTHTGKANFDGSLAVRNGSVQILDTIKFERHDQRKDRIIRKSNPIRWTSWIFNKYDGIKARVNARARAVLHLNTAAGGLNIPVRKLLSADEPIIFNLGDGRELVIKVNKIYTGTFSVAVAWGGPIPSIKPAITGGDPVAIATQIFTPKKLTTANVLPAPVDFSGKVVVDNGATMNLVRPFWFENNDKITENTTNHVAWQSSINGHFDGVLLKTKLDQVNPLDDRISVKFSEIEWSKSFSLTNLYASGIIREEIMINGKRYVLVLVAIKQPVCQSQLAQVLCQNQPTVGPIHSIKPIFKARPTSIKRVKTIKANRVPKFNFRKCLRTNSFSKCLRKLK